MSNAPICQACRRQVPAKYCEFTQGIGMLVIRTSRAIKGNLCRRCASKYFWEMTGLTLLTGWWGVISFISNIVYIISNIGYFISSRSLPDAAGGAPTPPTIARPQAPGNAATSASAPPGAPPPMPGRVPANPLAGFRNDIALRLRGGETPAQIAQFIAPRAGVSVAQTLQFIQAVAGGKA